MLKSALLASLLALPTFAQTSGSLEELAGFMVGSYSSAEQAKADPQNFKPIRLHMARIWPGRKDGVWLYVEQAEASQPDKPYRQRVYHVSTLPDGQYLSLIYTFKSDPLKYAGAWKEKESLQGVTLEALETRKGCGVFLASHGKGTYQGSTHAQDCESNLRGARYATSEVTITADTLVSWDRGYDAAGKQVWGAEKGGYIFRKQR